VTSRRWLTLQSYLARIGAGPLEMSGQRASALTGAYLPGFHPRGLDHTPDDTRLGDQVVSRPHARVFVTLLLAALAVRLAFWLYTGRIWEDALISLTAARNAWEGFGLTHHASEPPVQSFTSPLGEFILIVGEGFRHGFSAMRLASVLASAATVYYAYRIGLLFRFHWSTHVLVLGYLATDQLQVFFGMAGMETQVATAILMANAYYYASSQWWKLGVTAGLAALCRPEFVIWGAILGVTVLALHRDALCKIACFAAAVAAISWAAASTPNARARARCRRKC